MSQLPEILASAYTLEMNTLGAIPDIPVFQGERVLVSRNALTPGTRPLQLLPLPGIEFPVRHETDAMHGFQIEVDLCKAHAGGSSTDASAFWDLLDPPMRSRVVAAGFDDYAAGLHRTQPRFPPAMRYALMERWNNYTHTFIFGFKEMTLTPVDYTAITGLGFDGPAAPLDARWGSLALVHLYHGLDVWTRVSGESNWQFLQPLELLLTPWEGDAWTAYPARAVAEAYTQSRFLLRGYWLDRYFLGERVYELQMATVQRRVLDAPPHHMCLLEGMTREDREEEYIGSLTDIPLSAGDYATYFSTYL
ncbi:hypothetical protein JCGZ_19376 [Jatropha curcas]|uniref:Aminotransferase-like plant mobile domain-containing protein n=1 Tax=Jatropha curcas TaxID=180498 RepID=A0A067KBE2_JATCU|nr:hypothetical protein JCGZ_19376 [Jatropha curcas]